MRIERVGAGRSVTPAVAAVSARSALPVASLYAAALFVMTDSGLPPAESQRDA